MSTKKKLIIAIVTIVSVLLILATVLIVRNVIKNKPPELSAVAPRIEALITASREVNEILFGEGLPTYPRVYPNNPQPYYLKREGENFVLSDSSNGSLLYYYTFEDEDIGTILAYRYCVREKQTDNTYLYFDAENGNPLTVADYTKYRYVKQSESAEPGYIYTDGTHYFYKLTDYKEEKPEFYYSTSDDTTYDYVRNDCAYATIDSIKQKAATVYGSSYLSAIYDGLFTGITVSEYETGTLKPFYMEKTDEEGSVSLMKANDRKVINVNRVYLFDTMKMVKPSKADYINVEIETYLEGDEENKLTVRVSLIKENGNWYLDSPTY